MTEVTATTSGGGGGETGSGGGGGGTRCWVAGDDRVRKVVVGQGVAFALKDDGSLWCWGPFSCPAEDRDTERPRRAVIPCATNIAAEGARILGATDDEVVTWGGEIDGIARTRAGSEWLHVGLRLSWGIGGRAWTAERDFDPPLVAEVFAQPAHFVAHQGSWSVSIFDGKVYVVGSNEHGVYGDGTRETKGGPVAVNLPAAVVDVAAGGVPIIALLDDGRLFAWGAAPGLPSELITLVPRELPGFPTLCGITHKTWFGCGWTCDGEVWCWGTGPLFEGDGDWLEPHRIEDLEPAVHVDVSNDTPLCALKKDGTVWCRGTYGRGSYDLPMDRSATRVEIPPTPR